jgi:hypothetical protein
MNNEIKNYLFFPNDLEVDPDKIKFKFGWNEKCNEVTFIS